MQKVTVQINDLLEVLTNNGKEHHKKFLTAFDAYRDQVIANMESNLAHAKKGEHIAVVINLPCPEDHSDEYDRSIAMLTWAKSAGQDKLEISNQEFRNYVEDDWAWSHAFAATNARYGV